MTRNKDTYFNLYIDDFLGGVADLSAEEIGVYIILLCLMYDRDEGMLYDDDRRWAHRNNMSTRKYRIIKNKLLTEGKLCVVHCNTESFLTNFRVLSEQKTRQTMKDKRAESGRIGGLTTAENKKNANEINDTGAAPAQASAALNVAASITNTISSKKNPPRTPPKKSIGNYSPGEKEKKWATDYWSVKSRDDILLDEQVDQFRDHHIAHGKTMKSWPAAWKTWVRNAVKFTPQKKEQVDELTKFFAK